MSKKFGWKTRENVGDLHFLIVDNVDFARNLKSFVEIEFLDKNLTFEKCVLDLSVFRDHSPLQSTSHRLVQKRNTPLLFDVGTFGYNQFEKVSKKEDQEEL